jgi:hypothetical protein
VFIVSYRKDCHSPEVMVLVISWNDVVVLAILHIDVGIKTFFQSHKIYVFRFYLTFFLRMPRNEHHFPSFTLGNGVSNYLE